LEVTLAWVLTKQASYRAARNPTNGAWHRAIETRMHAEHSMRKKWNTSLISGGAIAMFLCGIQIAAQQSAPPQRCLLALSKRDHTLAIVDAATLQVIARLPVGPDPHEVVASSDGTKAYVSIYGFGRYHALSVLDLVAQKALPDVDTGALNGPHGLAFVGGKVWFTAEGAKAVGRFDPATSTIDWIMGTGQNRTHMLEVTNNEKQIYTTNVSSGTVSILEQVQPPLMGSPPGTQSQPRTQAVWVFRQSRIGVLLPIP
jgi:DNA-binding beta-propeller fold protein YncE